MSRRAQDGVALAGRVVLITGASSGIGLATARALGAECAALVLCARSASALDRAAELVRSESKTPVWVSSRNLTQASEVKALFDETIREIGALHVVIQAIGGGGGGPTDELPQEAWDDALATNLYTSYLVGMEACSYMRDSGGGVIVFLGSVTSLDPMRERVPTTVAKHALRGLVESVRDDWLSDGVAATMVHPGLIATERFGGLDETVGRSPLMLEYGSAASIGMGRMGTPDEVANVVREAVKLAPVVPEWVVDGGWRSSGLRIPNTLV